MSNYKIWSNSSLLSQYRHCINQLTYVPNDWDEHLNKITEEHYEGIYLDIFNGVEKELIWRLKNGERKEIPIEKEDFEFYAYDIETELNYYLPKYNELFKKFIEQSIELTKEKLGSEIEIICTFPSYFTLEGHNKMYFLNLVIKENDKLRAVSIWYDGGNEFNKLV